MSQFNFFNDLNSALTMDGDIRGPTPRWKKKLEASTISLNGSVNNTSRTVGLNGTSLSITNPPTKTPGKNYDNKGEIFIGFFGFLFC